MKIKESLGRLTVGVSAFILLGFGAVLASTGSATNDTTGANSNNEVKIEVKNDVDLDYDNDFDIDNKGWIGADTGNNEASYNTGDGDVETGDVDVALDIANMLGFEDGMIDFDFSGWDLEVGNDTTGYNSNNIAKAKVENKLDIDVDNDVDIDNKIKASLKTGNNSSSYNTGSGSVDSGSVGFSGSWENEVALGGGVLGSLSLPTGGDLSASNGTTGANSNNIAKVEVKNKLDVDVDNDVNIDNSFCINAKTGNNSSSYNTGSGSVSSGDVDVMLDLTNTVN